MINMLGPGGWASRVPRRWLLLGSAAVIVLGGLGLILMLRFFPSSPVAFPVVVKNNLDTAVQLGHCVGPSSGPICDVTEPEIKLAVGEQFTTLSGPMSRNPFVVRTPDGALLGCLPLEFTKVPTLTPTVYISEAGWCAGYLSP